MGGQILSAFLGAWLMASPDVLGYDRPARMNDHVVGPLIITFAVIAMWEFMRPVRWMNVFLGLWIFISTWTLHATAAASWNAAVCGIFVMLFAAWPSTYRPQLYGGGWESLWPPRRKKPNNR